MTLFSSSNTTARDWRKEAGAGSEITGGELSLTSSVEESEAGAGVAVGSTVGSTVGEIIISGVGVMSGVGSRVGVGSGVISGG